MLYRMLRETVRSHPEKTAIIHYESKISFKELYDSVTGFSEGLQLKGIKKGDCIALILRNCPEFVISYFAVARSKAVLIPVNPLLAEDELEHYINDSGATAIITDFHRADICNNIISRSGREITLITIKKACSSSILFDDLIHSVIDNDDDSDQYEGNFLYQYTSGSTGRPKRIIKTQNNVFHEACNYAATVNILSSDNILCIIPLHHGHGMDHCLLAATRTGATLAIMEDYKKDGMPISVPFVLRRARVLELIVKEKITNLPGVPFIFSSLAEIPDDHNLDLSALTHCFTSGNFLPKDVFDRFMQRFGIPLRQIYGCTETGSISVNLERDDEIHFDSVGLPLKTIDVKIFDDEGNKLPHGSLGEIAVKSPAMTSEYSNMPELNKEVFKDGYFLTGDLGEKDERGLIYVTGRKKLIIETGGHKVDPYEIEDVIITHPNVKEAVVVGIKGPYDSEIIKAVIVPDGKCSDTEIISFCKGKLTDYKIPQLIEFRDEIPKSPLGKILRKDLI